MFYANEIGLPLLHEALIRYGEKTKQSGDPKPYWEPAKLLIEKVSSEKSVLKLTSKL